MTLPALRLMSALALAPLSLPAIADDCASAWLTSAQRPVSMVITKTDAHGKQTKAGMVQTLTTQYVQTPDGVWHSVDIGIKDKIDDSKTAKVTCRRVGIELIDGVPTTVYMVHYANDGDEQDSKAWVSPSSLILKAEGDVSGEHYVTTYDYSHVVAPANAKPMGGH